MSPVAPPDTAPAASGDGAEGVIAPEGGVHNAADALGDAEGSIPVEGDVVRDIPSDVAEEPSVQYTLPSESYWENLLRQLGETPGDTVLGELGEEPFDFEHYAAPKGPITQAFVDVIARPVMLFASAAVGFIRDLPGLAILVASLVWPW